LQFSSWTYSSSASGRFVTLILERLHHVLRDGCFAQSGLSVQHDVLWSATEENVLERVAVLIDLFVALENLVRLMIFRELPSKRKSNAQYH